MRDSGNVEIAANGTERIVLGLALDDVTKGITSADFTYTITISRGELPTSVLYAPNANSSNNVFVKSKDDSNDYVDIGQGEYVDSDIETTQIEQSGITLNVAMSKMELQNTDNLGISFEITPNKPLIGMFVFNDCHNEKIGTLIQKGLAYLTGENDTDILYSYIDPFLISQSGNLSPLESINSSIPTLSNGKFTIVVVSVDEISSILYTNAQTKSNVRLVTYDNLDKIASIELPPPYKLNYEDQGIGCSVGFLNLKLTNIPQNYSLYNFEITNLNEIVSGTSNESIMLFSYLIFPGNYYSVQEFLSAFLSFEDMTMNEIIGILLMNGHPTQATIELKYKQNNELEFCCVFFGYSEEGFFVDSVDLNKIKCNVSYSNDLSDIFHYNLKEDNTYEVAGLKVYDFIKDANSDKYDIFSGYQDILTIPNKYKGIDVTSVRNDAFSCQDIMKTHPSRIVISENIKDLGEYSFSCWPSEVYIQSQDVVDMIINDEIVTAGSILSGSNCNLYIRTDLKVTEYIESLEKLPDIVEYDNVEYFCYIHK